MAVSRESRWEGVCLSRAVKAGAWVRVKGTARGPERGCHDGRQVGDMRGNVESPWPDCKSQGTLSER